MAAIPPKKNNLASRIYGALEAKTDQTRAHLGASQIGHHCPRWLWLSFHWAIVEKHSGRILRLFRRGQDEEARIIEDLRSAGLEISETDQTGHQHRVSFGSHFSGSCDGIVLSGVPEAPAKKHVLEIKTHSKKSFDDLEKHGVKKSKPQHEAQMQVYMHGLDIDRALYVAVCKDDDRIYTERVRYEPDDARGLVQLADEIISAERPPEPISADPSWYQCRWCAAHSFCHKGENITEANCRTCAHSTAEDEGWTCAVWGEVIPVHAQPDGCRNYVPHPDLVPKWPIIDGVGDWSALYRTEDGEKIIGQDGEDGRSLVRC